MIPPLTYCHRRPPLSGRSYLIPLVELEKLKEVFDIFVYTPERVYATGISSFSRSAIEEGEFPMEMIDTFDHIPQFP